MRHTSHHPMASTAQFDQNSQEQFFHLPLLETVTPTSLYRQIRDGLLMPGDSVLFRQVDRGLVNRIISYGEKKAAPFVLGGEGLSKDAIKFASWFTHYAIIGDRSHVYENWQGSGCRRRTWVDLAGHDLLFMRPVFPEDMSHDEIRDMLLRVAHEARLDICNNVGYPLQEILYYGKFVTAGFRRYIPFLRNKSLFDLFDDKDENKGVCAAQGFRWHQRAGIVPSDPTDPAYQRPITWFPSRFLLESAHPESLFRSIRFVRVVADNS